MEGINLVPGLIMFGVPLLPFMAYYISRSRSQEHEADFIGMMLLADEGYDPSAAVRFFEKMDIYEKKVQEKRRQTQQKGRGNALTLGESDWQRTDSHVSVAISLLFCIFPRH